MTDVMSTQGQFPGAAGESERTRRLRSLGLNDPSADEAFDRFAHLAASITRAPIAMVNFINDERQMFRGLYIPPNSPEVVADEGASWADRGIAFDLPTRQMPLSHGFCPHVVAQRSPLALDDILAYPRFAGNPVVDELGVRAYLGAPLVDDTKTVIGTVCVLDREPRQWGRERLRDIQHLAEALLSEIRLRDNLLAQQQEMFAAFDGSPFPIMLTDGPGQEIRYANAQHAETFGAPAAYGAIGVGYPQLGAAGLQQAVAEAYHTGRATVLNDVRIQSGREGQRGQQIFSFTCTPMRTARTGQINGVLTVGMDVTAQSRTEEELGTLAALLVDRLQQSGTVAGRPGIGGDSGLVLPG
ncbi:GAF domain-containing protein [Streptomyces kaniharaensis]|uniref:GAF domain-containing protein n=1 Tax=Streptomyces kaniharaensis TaxID=212423 RepID=A0A6N7KXC9_9ACTN|nr:GAF domain-containing protein [Streptomyces kaniharaensis]MQS14997.1 GAF domain-containing protein [Streptomyces kaniharaensis]